MSLLRIRHTTIAGLLVLCLGYCAMFVITDRGDSLSQFDSVTSLDMAQIARNTADGEFLRTRSVTPVGYTLLGRLDNHPDFMRYPLPTLVYAALFTVAPQTAATVKLLNAALFVLNGLLCALIAWSTFERIRLRELLGPRCSPASVAALAWASSIIVSFQTQQYLRSSLSDDCEVLTTALMLTCVIALQRQAKLWLGLALGLLYLSRTNMGIFMPLGLVFIALRARDRGLRAMLRDAGIVLLGFVVVVCPFVIRSYVYSGDLLFSLPAVVEVGRGIEGSPKRFPYNHFHVPDSLWVLLKNHRDQVGSKLMTGVIKALRVLTAGPNRWGLVLMIPALLTLRQQRPVIVLLLVTVAVHSFAVSFFIQPPRIYVPFEVALFVFSAIALVACSMLALRLVVPTRPAVTDNEAPDEQPESVSVKGSHEPESLDRAEGSPLPDRWAAGWRVLLPIAAASLLITIPLATPKVTKPETAGPKRMTAPSSEVLATLADLDIRCAYTNNQFWLVWETELIVMPVPPTISEIYAEGPESCRHFVRDKRFRKQLSMKQIRRNAEKIATGPGFELYHFNQSFSQTEQAATLGEH